MRKVFLDTNILVYALDSTESGKQARARQIIFETANSVALVVSTQVVQEFYNVVTRKFGVEKLKAKRIIRAFTGIEIITIDMQMIESAIDISILSDLSFWDSLIIAAAETSGCHELLSEDLNTGQSVNRVKIINPFDTKLGLPYTGK
ncbi:MAG: PIN domain-containing protein [Clostridiales bacterium]|nr:PIN domain-containing protein [Clostridiales bacterium]